LLILLLLLLFLLLLSLSGCSFLDLLRQSERGFLAWSGALVNTRAGTGLLRRTDGCDFLVLGRLGSMVGRKAFSTLHAEIAFLRSQCMKLTKPVFAGGLLEKAVSLSTVKLFLFLLQPGTVLQHRGYLLGMKEIVRLPSRKRRRAAEGERIRSTHVQAIKERRKLMWAIDQIGSDHLRPLPQWCCCIEEAGHRLGWLLLHWTLNRRWLKSNG
jgi:hypothetical protein